MAMMQIFNSVFSGMNQGVIWAIMGIGLYMSFRVLDFADMTTDGTLMLGVATTATCIMRGINPWLALLLALVLGAVAGFITAFLNTKLKIQGLIAGIITQTGLWSINMHIMGASNDSLSFWDGFKQGTSNIGLRNKPNIFNALTEKLTALADNIGIASNIYPKMLSEILMTLLILAVIMLILTWFLKTQTGLALRATGINPRMIRALGVDTDKMMILGLMISNAIVALGGGVYVQSNGAADNLMGIGAIAFGLINVITGDLFPFKSMFGRFCSIILGSIIYRIFISLIMYFGVNPVDTKVATAILMVLFLTIPSAIKELGSDIKKNRTIT